MCFFFFFQAEDGIRGGHVTGVQTCALPIWGGTTRLPRLVGHSLARRLMISGQSIKAEEASQIGLVDRIVNSAEDLAPLIKGFFRDLAKPGPEAVLAVKRVLRGASEIDEF